MDDSFESVSTNIVYESNKDIERDYQNNLESKTNRVPLLSLIGNGADKVFEQYYTQLKINLESLLKDNQRELVRYTGFSENRINMADKLLIGNEVAVNKFIQKLYGEDDFGSQKQRRGEINVETMLA